MPDLELVCPTHVNRKIDYDSHFIIRGINKLVM